jgi:FMN reductase (NADPH)
MERSMPNLTVDLIHRHGSVRHYKSDPVPAETIETLIAAAQRTSSSSNLQAYSVVAVTDGAQRARLAELCGNQEHIAQAPVFLAWCADLARLDRACELRGYSQVTGYVENFLVAAVDAAIAAQTAALAAESLGLGICYIGSIRNNTREVIDLLALPKLVFPITGMTVGWPASQPSPRPRLPLQGVLHWGHYDRTAEDETLRTYDQAMAATGIYQGRQVPVPGKPGEMEDYGWTEHSARRVAQAMRTDLRKVIEQQGFALKQAISRAVQRLEAKDVPPRRRHRPERCAHADRKVSGRAERHPRAAVGRSRNQGGDRARRDRSGFAF